MAQETSTGFYKEWMGDFGSREHLVAGTALVDPTQFLSENGTRVTLTAGAAEGAVTIAFAATTNPIPAGTLLYFGVGKYARTTAVAAAGATSVAVEALPAALLNADVATYAGNGRVYIPSGTFIGRTIVERDAQTPYGPWTTGDGDRWLTAFDIQDATKDASVSLYRRGGQVKENKLPGWDSRSNGEKTQIRADYECYRGAA